MIYTPRAEGTRCINHVPTDPEADWYHGYCVVLYSSQLLSARSIHTTALLDDLDLLQLFRATDLESLDEFDYVPSQYETTYLQSRPRPTQSSEPIPPYTPAPAQPMVQSSKPVLSPIKHVCAVLHNRCNWLFPTV